MSFSAMDIQPVALFYFLADSKKLPSVRRQHFLVI
jgi:hypothetical protein